MTDVTFRCACGTLEGTIRGASAKTGTHAECFCSSCRAAEVYAGAPDPAPDPVGIFQTSPHRITITQGREMLTIFSFGQKNLLRWRTKCCGSAMFNTPRNPAVSFVGLRTTYLQDIDAIGPVSGQGFIPSGTAKPRHKGLFNLLFKAILRIIGNRLTGRWKDTPFFDPKTRLPIAPVSIVTKEDRAALLS